MTLRDGMSFAHEYSKQGRKYVLTTDGAVTLAGAAFFLYLLNDAGQSDIWITHINATATAAGMFTAEVVTGTAAGGTAPDPVASKVGGAAMTDVTTRLHTAVTGLTGTDVMAASERGAGADPNLVHESHGLILPAGFALALQFDTAADVVAEIHMVR